jgi:spore coat polysaccharide biosynthesis protein SpsF (cytidylyltransferase family)
MSQQNPARILGVLQARTSSSRLPGKVLLPILGQPMILRQIERLKHARRMDMLVLATSIDPSDDALAEAVAASGIAARWTMCWRASSAQQPSSIRNGWCG